MWIDMLHLQKRGTDNSFCVMCHSFLCQAQQQTCRQWARQSAYKRFTPFSHLLPHPTILFSPSLLLPGEVGGGGGGGKSGKRGPCSHSSLSSMAVQHLTAICLPFQQWVMAAWVCSAVMWHAQAKAQDTKERKPCFSSLGHRLLLLLLPLSFPPPFALFSVWEAFLGL